MDCLDSIHILKIKGKIDCFVSLNEGLWEVVEAMQSTRICSGIRNAIQDEYIQ